MHYSTTSKPGTSITTLIEMTEKKDEDERRQNELNELKNKLNELGNGIFEFVSREVTVNEGEVWSNITVYRTYGVLYYFYCCSIVRFLLIIFFIFISGTFGKVSVNVVPMEIDPQQSSSVYIPTYTTYSNKNQINNTLNKPSTIPKDSHISGIRMHNVQQLIYQPGETTKHFFVAVIDDHLYSSHPRKRLVQLMNATGGSKIGLSTCTLIVKENDQQKVTPSPENSDGSSSTTPSTDDELLSSIQVTLSMTINTVVSTKELMQPSVIEDMEKRLATVLSIDVTAIQINDIWYCPDSNNVKCTSSGSGSRLLNDGIRKISISFTVISNEETIQSIETILVKDSFKESLNKETSSSLSSTLKKEIQVETKTITVTKRTKGGKNMNTPSSSIYENDSIYHSTYGMEIFIIIGCVIIVLILLIFTIGYKKYYNRKNKIKDIGNNVINPKVS
jgi:hypothetical protein